MPHWFSIEASGAQKNLRVTGGREGEEKGEKERVERETEERRIVQMTFWRNGLEMTPKSPRFKAVLLFKMQTWQIETKKNIYFDNVLKGYLY